MESRINTKIVKYTYFGVKASNYFEVVNKIKGVQKLDNEGNEEYWIEASIPNINLLLELGSIPEEVVTALKTKKQAIDHIVLYI